MVDPRRFFDEQNQAGSTSCHSGMINAIDVPSTAYLMNHGLASTAAAPPAATPSTIPAGMIPLRGQQGPPGLLPFLPAARGSQIAAMDPRGGAP